MQQPEDIHMNTLIDRQCDSTAYGAYQRMKEAWQWLCEQRSTAPEDADIWHVRWQQFAEGPAYLTQLVNSLLRGEYRLSPLLLCGKGEQRKAIWGAQDALVLKWVALSLQNVLPLHSSCEHTKGHGGGKQSIQRLHLLLTATENEKKMPPEGLSPFSRGYRWVCRTDIRGYYRNINKATLLSQVKRHVRSDVLCGLVEQYLYYTVEDGGMFHTPEKGISRGCPLSPLMGALHLYDMDEHFSEQKNIHYARYMDDVIILAKSRWQLRRHTKQLMQWFRDYGFEAHPDKTFIGRAEKGFDWMGAWLKREGVTDIAPRAKANHREKVRRLYERLARVPLWARKRERQRVNAKVSTYRKRWTIWAGALMTVSSPSHAGITGPSSIATVANGVPVVIAGINGVDADRSSEGGDTGYINAGVEFYPPDVAPGVQQTGVCNGVTYYGVVLNGIMIYLRNGTMTSRAPIYGGDRSTWVFSVSTDSVGKAAYSGNVYGSYIKQLRHPAYSRVYDGSGGGFKYGPLADRLKDAADARGDLMAVSCPGLTGYRTGTSVQANINVAAGMGTTSKTVLVKTVADPSCALSLENISQSIIKLNPAPGGQRSYPVAVGVNVRCANPSSTQAYSVSVTSPSVDALDPTRANMGSATSVPALRGVIVSKTGGTSGTLSCTGNIPGQVRFDGVGVQATGLYAVNTGGFNTTWIACPPADGSTIDPGLYTATATLSVVYV